MSGDYSRIAFDPLRNYGSVLLQQGRPLTDRDWNDQGAAVNRRAQAGTLDASGAVIVAGPTPDAFKIMPGLLIGPGRMYVDGLLADNHGIGPQKWGAALAELYGTNAVPINKQPYLPGASAPPSTGGPYLIYLDVWNREVTQFQDPDLVEKALGVDTTTRLQTIWQVKWLDQINATTTCATPLDRIPAWLAATAPSAGRLSTGTGPVPNLDPCLVPPAGGYKGLENQLYRVEVHTAGKLGTATFKWSRDNASVEARLTRLIDSSHIVIDSVGRDSVLRFRDGDWIEVTDDWRELNGQAGALHKIKVGGGVDDATRTITLDKPLTINLGTPDAQGHLDPARHARIRRWDQKGLILAQDGSPHTDLNVATSTGAIVVPAGGQSLRLENGLLVTFSVDPTGGDFHVGDYWVFAARSSDASVEILSKAPPRSIHHHYARLAIYTPPSGLQDCRPKPEECCCTFTVSPGGDIQAAIDALPAAGGCVCLKTGVHIIPQGLLIARSNVKLVGESHGTIVRSPRAGVVLMIGGTATPIEGIEISMIAFERNWSGQSPIEVTFAGIGTTNTSARAAASTDFNVAAVVAASNVRRGAILDCGARSVPAQQSIGIQLANVEELHVTRCRVESVAVGIFVSGLLSRTLFFDDNVISLLGADPAQSTAYGIIVQRISGPCRIAGNSFHGAASAIIVSDQLFWGPPQRSATGVIVAKNVVVSPPGPPWDSHSNVRVFAIDVAAQSAIVSQNSVTLPAGASRVHTGIRVTGDNLDVIDNTVGPGSNVVFDNNFSGLKLTAGAFTGIQVGEQSTLTSDVRVAGNIVDGARMGIVAISATTVMIESNIVQSGGGVETFGVYLWHVTGGRVQGNRVTGGVAISSSSGVANRVTDNALSEGTTGVMMTNETTPAIAQNRIYAMASAGIQCGAVTGRCDIVENRITACGFGNLPRAGIMTFQVNGELRIEGNQVIDTGLGVAPAVGIAGVRVLEASIEGNYVGYTHPVGRSAANEDRALTITCLLEKTLGLFGRVVREGYPIQILGNKFVGTGKSALVEILDLPSTGQQRMRFERVLFSNNYCFHYPLYGVPATQATTAATVVMFGRVATAVGNQVKAMPPPTLGMPPFPSFNFNNMPGPFMGNITAGAVLLHNQFPIPRNGFNLTA